MSTEGGNEGSAAAQVLVPSQAVKSSQQKTANRKRRKRKPKPVKQNTGESVVAGDAESNGTGCDANHSNENSSTNRNKTIDKEKAKKKPKPRKKKNKKKFPWRKALPPNSVDPISLEPLNSMPYPPFALNISPPYDIVPEWPVCKSKQEDAAGTDTKKEGATNLRPGDGNAEEAKAKQRQDELLQEQWGALLPNTAAKIELGPVSENGKQEDDQARASQNKGGELNKKQHFHLFDGHVLAVYLVSTLQFIDPLNRRDLTREEVKNLDVYLARHRLKKMRVLEAYDEKGVSMSSAGANAQTQSGRLRMRQEEARNLMNSLFQDHAGVQRQQPQRQNNRNRRDGGMGGNNIGNRPNRSGDEAVITNNMPDEYASLQSNQHSQQVAFSAHDQSQYYTYDSWNDYGNGLYADNDGMIIIDDDINPGLRSGLPNAASTNNGDLPSWNGHRAMQSSVEAFPSLPSADSSGPSSGTNNTNRPEGDAQNNEESKAMNQSTTKPKIVSKSLSTIGKFSTKSNPKQLEKQRKARELALRKAQFASMPYEEAIKRAAEGNNTDSVILSSHDSNKIPVVTDHLPPTEMQLERNRNLAEALDVKPATMRSNINSGWTRPTEIPATLDEFGNELNLTQYPDALIIEARERMTELLRLEKKWLSFLKDDKAASCPLKPMERPLRKFVHAYSDFWNLHTQSFDPQPKRYIHCVKMLETRAPRPLLSVAVRTWRGPAPPISVDKKVAALTEQTAGEETMSSREFVLSEERVPLKLEPRKVTEKISPPPGAMFDLVDEDDIGRSITAPYTHQEPASRFAPILAERERTTLKLDRTTAPPGAVFDLANKAGVTNLISGVATILSQEPAARFAPILAERERPILKLDARTKPLELPKYQPAATVNTDEMSRNYHERMNAAAEKKRAEDERKKMIMAAAFESDDESSESEWEVEEPLVTGSDDE